MSLDFTQREFTGALTFLDILVSSLSIWFILLTCSFKLAPSFGRDDACQRDGPCTIKPFTSIHFSVNWILRSMKFFCSSDPGSNSKYLLIIASRSGLKKNARDGYGESVLLCDFHSAGSFSAASPLTSRCVFYSRYLLSRAQRR